jgi:hypothetical protein
MSNADRVRRHKAKLAARGLAQVNLWLPLKRKASFLDAARRVREDPDLDVNVHKAKRERAGA